MSDIIGALFGPLGGILAGGAAVIMALVLGRWQGGKRANERHAGQAAQDYRDTRKEIDNADLGHGATDQQRVDSLREIARRRGVNSPD